MRSVTKLGAVLLSAPLITGCIDDASDPDSGGTLNTAQVSGVAVDGPLAGALVYADLNDDGQRQGFEPSARTDEYGYFSYRPSIDGEPARNYCEEGPQRHCLRVDTSSGEVRIRVQSGFDTVTGEAFRGSISGLVSIPATDDISVRAITPLTAASLNPARASGNFWSTREDELEPTDAFRAYHKHQSLVDLAQALIEDFRPSHDWNQEPESGSFEWDDEPGLTPFVAALYRPLRIKLSGETAWWGLSTDQLEEVVFSAIQSFDDRIERFDINDHEAIQELQAQLVSIDGIRDTVEEFNHDQLTGAVRSLRAFLNSGESDSEPLQWALEEIANPDCDGDTHLNRVRINAMRDQMNEPDAGKRNFCKTLGSGSFPDLEDRGTVQFRDDTDPDKDLDLTFGENGELSVNGKALGDDFENDVITGSYSQPTDDQILINLEAFGGAYSESASLNIVNDGEDSEEKFEYEFRFGDDETKTYALDDDPFGH